MSPEQIELVQRTWRKVMPIGDIAAELFYGKLFSLDPTIRLLFTGDMKDQGRNLTAMISIAVGGLARLENVARAVRDLGRRHASYGVQPRHYPIVGAALLWTLEKCLGEAFTAEVKLAWSEAYGVLANTMQGAVEARAATR